MNIKQLFEYKPDVNYNFTLSASGFPKNNKENLEKEICNSIVLNLKYIQSKYNTEINSDIIIREFSLTARNTRIQGFSYLY